MKQYTKSFRLIKDHPILATDLTGFIARVIECMLTGFQTRFKLDKIDLTKSHITYNFKVDTATDPSYNTVTMIATVHSDQKSEIPFDVPKFQ